MGTDQWRTFGRLFVIACLLAGFAGNTMTTRASAMTGSPNPIIANDASTFTISSGYTLAIGKVGNGMVTKDPDWDTAANPTVVLSTKTEQGSQSVTGALNSSITGQTPTILYHVRAYATNTSGTSYGEDVTNTPTYGLTTTTPSTNARTGTNVTGRGTLAWTNPGYITADDTSYAMASVGQNITTQYLEGTNYGFAIPSNAAINGIAVNIGRYSSGTSTPRIRDTVVSLVKGSMLIGSNKGATTTDWPTTTIARVTYGSSADLWGTTWTPADLNASNFGVALAVNNTNTSSRTAYVDYMRVTVTYTVPTNPTLATVTTQAACSITRTTATGNGNITSLGVPNPTQYGLVWDTAANPTIALSTKTQQGVPAGTGAFTNSITGLRPYTLYYVRAYATNIAGTAYGNDVTFTTLGTLPTVTTQAATAVATTTATGNGNISNLGIPNPTQYGVVWDTAAIPTVALTTKTQQGVPSGTGAFTSSITGLTPGTLYHVRVYATNAAGTGYGADVQFTTVAVAPTVTTQAVSNIGTTTATGNGTIVSLGGPNPTQYGVVWNTSSNPTVALSTKTQQGSISVTEPFTSSITGLTQGTLYFLRAYATNTAGTAYGEEVTFLTNIATQTTTPARNAGAGANVTGVGAVAWSNPGNITTVGAPYATITLNSQQSNYLQGTNYGFSIPGNATINGIIVTINRNGIQGTGNDIRDVVVRPIKNGVVTGNNKAATLTDWPTSFTVARYGSTSDLWGATWTPADINNTNFGVALSVNSAGSSKTATVDTMQIAVTYTVTTAGTITSVNCGAGTPVVAYRSPITCVATVVRASGSNTPTGNVSWTTNSSGNIVTSPCVLSGSNGTAACSVTYTPTTVGTGAHLLTATYAGDANFYTGYGSQTVTVNKLDASVTANPAGKTYSEVDPMLTCTLAGFLPADNVLPATASREPGEDVGTYLITCRLNPVEVLANYNIIYHTANFTINKKDASVTPDALSKTYEDTDQALTGTLTGFRPADNITASYGRTPGEAVGTYLISAALSPANQLGNYNITYNTAAFTILPPVYYPFVVNIVGSGTVARNPDKATYRYGDVVTLTPTADPGWTFFNWSPNVVGGQVTITGDTTVTAMFAQDEYTLTILSVGNGRVTKNPDQPTYHYGDLVCLTSVPDPYWRFSRWSENVVDGCIIIHGNTTVSAEFTQDPCTLTITNVGSGTVTKNPDKMVYACGEVVTLTANPDPGWSLGSWSENVVDGKVIIQGNTIVSATFTHNEYTLTTDKVGSGIVTKDPDQVTYHYGDVVTLTATPDPGWTFGSWSTNAPGGMVRIQDNTTVSVTFWSAPTVTTQAVTAITMTTATGNGNITDLGVPDPTQYGVVWDTAANPDISLPTKTQQGVPTSAGAFTSHITGLIPGTLYHIRAYASNDAGTSYGEDVSFDTLLAPTVTTQAVTNIGQTTATGNGTITSLGVPNPTQHGVVWSAASNPTTADNKTSDGPVSGTGPFASSITSLIPGTLYHVRAYATNIAGTAYGDDVTFTTAVPVVAATISVSCGAGTPVVAYGSSITCVAAVTRSSGSNTPAGTVSWTSNGGGSFATSPCVLSGSNGTASCPVTYIPANVGSGSHLVTAAYAGDPNFLPSSGSQAVTVNRIDASVTPNDASKTVGDPDPVFTGMLSGFLPADNVTATYARVPGEAVGTYPINPTLSPAEVLGNYNITDNSGAFTIYPQTGGPYTLTIHIVGQGTVTPEPDPQGYPFGKLVILTAHPDPGWVLSGFAPLCNAETFASDTCGIFMYSNWTVTATFSPENHRPTFTSTPVTTAMEDTPYIYDITADDPDGGNTLTFGWWVGTKPAWLTLTDHHNRTATLSGTPANPGVQDVNLYVSDGSADGFQSFTITVANVNDPPGFTSTPVTSATQGLGYTYHITVSDPDTGDTLTITAPVLPAWLTLTDHGNGTVTLSGTPTNDDVGQPNAVVLQVSDGTEVAGQSFSITVVNVNDAPVLAQPDDQTSVKGSPASLQLSAADIDLPADTLTYSATGLPDGLTIKSATGLISGTITAAPGPYPVTASVDDSHGGRDSKTFTWMVTPRSFHLTLVVSPEGAGSTDPAVGEHSYTEGSVVALGATPNPGYTFTVWSGDPDCADGNVIMNADKACKATFTPIVLGAGTYDDVDPAWTYMGNWLALTFDGPYAGTDHLSTTIGDSAQVRYTGAQFSLTYSQLPDRGMVDVYIDGTKAATVDENGMGAWQQTWNSDPLPTGQHTVQLVHAGGAVIDIDAISVKGLIPDSFSKVLPITGGVSQPTSLILDWADSNEATSYAYCYDTTNDNTCSNWISTGETSQASLRGLSASTTYYWQARATNSAGTTYADGGPTAFWNFTTGAESEMVLIPAGSFQMGCDPAHNGGYLCEYDEVPLHTVTLDAYQIDRFEVTNGQYTQCVAAGNCAAPSITASSTRSSYYNNPAYASYPVIYVSWQDAHNYCAWAGKRLPTEAEWEKAARGDSDTRVYPWGDASPTCNLVNGDINGACVGDTSAVGSHPAGASPYGVMDLAGNVWEWVNDWYQPDYYSISPSTNPQGPASGSYKVPRGGSWLFPGEYLRLADRDFPGPNFRTNTLGFRCAAPPGN